MGPDAVHGVVPGGVADHGLEAGDIGARSCWNGGVGQFSDRIDDFSKAPRGDGHRLLSRGMRPSLAGSSKVSAGAARPRKSWWPVGSSMAEEPGSVGPSCRSSRDTSSGNRPKLAACVCLRKLTVIRPIQQPGTLSVNFPADPPETPSRSSHGMGTSAAASDPA